METRSDDNTTVAYSDPAEDAKLVTPDDANDLPSGTCRGLFVGGAGNIKVTTFKGTTLLITGVPVGIFPLRVKRVFSTTTTATNIAALY